MPLQELQARLRSIVFERQTWELRRAKEAAHLHEYYTQTQQQLMGPAEHRAHVRCPMLSTLRLGFCEQPSTH
jgi:hypothetical protein